MLGVCGGRWTAVAHIPLFTRCAASDFLFVLLARTPKSSTFRLALVCVALFSAVVFALLGYVYWATTDYVRSRYDRAISADRALIALIDYRIAQRGFEAGIYLLANPSQAVLAGNLKRWPPSLRAVQGWADFEVPEVPGHQRVRATYGTLPDGSQLLVGRGLDDLDRFVRAIKTALVCGAILALMLAAFSGVSVTRRTVGRIEAINATTRDIMRSGLGKRIPLRGTKDEWDQLAQNLNAMLDRIEDLLRAVGQVSDNM